MPNAMQGEISVDDPRGRDVRALLERHLAFANTHSPPEDVHALDVSGLVDPAVTFFSFRNEGRLLAVGAIRTLDADHAELKSMHTAEEARGQGLGRANSRSSDRGRPRTRRSQSEHRDGNRGTVRTGTFALPECRIRALRTVRRVFPQSQQHLHDALAGLRRPGGGQGVGHLISAILIKDTARAMRPGRCPRSR